jgi:DNA (cytosine-5)-methyltransferase 1
MFEYIRAVRELLQASGRRSPRYILWENVPGALSSERGVAFGQLLAELDELGYGLAWRVLDAQYVRVPDGSPDGFFGPVAQRRRRVFLVGVLGSPHAAEILFERTCLSGDHPKGREAREALAADPAEGAGIGGCAGFKFHQGGSAKGVGFEMNQSPTLTADWHQPAIISVTTANTNANGSNVSDEGTAYTLDLANSNAIAFAQNTRDEVRIFQGDGQVVGALAAQPGMKQTSYVCMADDNAKASIDADMCGSLKVGGGATVNSNGENVVGPLCARDFKGVGSEYVSEGKVICQRHTC